MLIFAFKAKLPYFYGSSENRINSKVGEGTKIVISIPAKRSSKDIPHGTKRVKIYDDNPVVVKMTSDMLRRLGHCVVESDYNLILTDMEMGEISGLDILERTGNVPVIVMTGRGNFSSEKASELGSYGFLTKPFTIDSLREIIGNDENLDDFLGDSRDEIIALFYTSTKENFQKLREALLAVDYKQAQAICHKMYPMFAQMKYPTEELRKMDLHRNGNYEGWREDVEKILAIKI